MVMQQGHLGRGARVALHVLHHQAEVVNTLDAQFFLQRQNNILIQQTADTLQAFDVKNKHLSADGCLYGKGKSYIRVTD